MDVYNEYLNLKNKTTLTFSFIYKWNVHIVSSALPCESHTIEPDVININY